MLQGCRLRGRCSVHQGRGSIQEDDPNGDCRLLWKEMNARLALLILLVSVVVQACSRQPQTTGQSGRQNFTGQPSGAARAAPARRDEEDTSVHSSIQTQATGRPVPAAARDELSRAAVAEAERRRGTHVVVRSSRFQEGRWVFFLEDADSEAVGRACWVEVSTNSVVLGYHGGR